VVVRDPGGLTATVSVSVTIVNSGPVAAPDTIDVSSGTARNVSIIDNDSDPDGNSAALRIQSVPASMTFQNGVDGSITIGPAGRSITVDPGGGLGTATVSYTVVDPDGAVSAPATLTIIGPRLNTAPTAGSQTVTVTAGVPTQVVLDAADADGDPLSVEVVTDPLGVVTGQVGLTVTVTALASGSTSFTFRAFDGTAYSDVATITVIVAPPPTTIPTTVPPPTTPPGTGPSGGG
jgi:hypothetical protein